MCERHSGGLSAEQLRDRDEQRARQAVLRVQELEAAALGYGALTADEKAEAAALYNGTDPRLWSHQIVILAHTIAPDVAAKLLHFNVAHETALAQGACSRAPRFRTRSRSRSRRSSAPSSPPSSRRASAPFTAC
jgi:hypothetical protein